MDIIPRIKYTNWRYVRLGLQLVVSFIPLIILTTSLDTLLYQFRMICLFQTATVIIFAVTAFFNKSEEFLKLTRILVFYNLLVISIIFLIYYVSNILVITNYYGFEGLFRKNVKVAKWIYFFICFFHPIALPIPEAITVLAASAVFGSFYGFIIDFVGIFLGNATMFFLARYGGLKVVNRFIKTKHLSKYNEYVKKNETLFMTILLIIPILPDEIVSVGAGISEVKAKKYLFIVGISKLITSFLIAYSIKLRELLSLSTNQIMILISIIVLTGFLIASFIKKKRKLTTNEK
ncbi:TVP38/TMEM64 family protein [Gottfriedia luciferensis]|uniref:TVP38/TMEM64 family protein n=1 Tax=Gottfriedia luciferensis TaxID=178774 RepID=UPI001302AE63|nr:VTT domain-containing protein [Gottfriedia luciferensis]